MSSQKKNQNPFQLILKTCEKLVQCVQTQFSHFTGNQNGKHHPLLSFSSSSSVTPITEANPSLPPSSSNILIKPANPVTKEELGRATWTVLHTLAAQYPDCPTRQQKKDVKELMAILSRIYPCRECADHFKDVLSANPVQAGSQAEFSQWLCHVHNVVNRSLGKVVFPCQRIVARWGKLDCKERACDLEGATEYRWPS
ncbi:thiol oxidase [Ranunculus cassubicifolius]